MSHSTEEKSPQNEFPIHTAIESGNISEVKKMLEYYPDHINKPDKQNISPLMMCSKLGHVHIAKVLIESGAEINFKGGSNGNTSLHVAARMGIAEVLEFLLKMRIRY